MSTSPTPRTFKRSMDEWYVLEYARLISIKHGNAPPLTAADLVTLTDIELNALISQLEVLARIPPK